MKTTSLKQQSKLATYLTVTAGSGFAAIAADGATVVTFYGKNAMNDTNPDPAGISVGRYDNGYGRYAVINNSAASIGYGSGYFNRGTDSLPGFGGAFGVYRNFSDQFTYGAVSGDLNYANVSFNGNDAVYEAVAQFHFGAPGEGYLIAIARNDDGSALSISEGAAAIATVPEPSSLALLALGSAGLLARRNRKAAA